MPSTFEPSNDPGVEVIDSRHGFGRDPGDEDPERVTKLKDAVPIPKIAPRADVPLVLAADRKVASPDGA